MNANSNSSSMGDKERINDCLMSQKQITSSYNVYAGECVNPQLRDEMLCILKEEHDIQADLFCQMQTHGWYQVPPAEANKVQQAYQKFSSSQG
jgi:spore coat protein CotF